MITTILTLAALASLLIPLLTVIGTHVLTEEIMAIQLAGWLVLCLGFAYAVRAAEPHHLPSSKDLVATPAE